MTSPILRGPSRRKRCQNPDTTALSVRKRTPQKTLQNHRYTDLCPKRPKEMVCGMHIKDKKNGKQVSFSFSKIWWASKVSLLAIENDCVARSYRFSVPLTCTRAIIRQKVYFGYHDVMHTIPIFVWSVSAAFIRVFLVVVLIGRTWILQESRPLLHWRRTVVIPNAELDTRPFSTQTAEPFSCTAGQRTSGGSRMFTLSTWIRSSGSNCRWENVFVCECALLNFSLFQVVPKNWTTLCKDKQLWCLLLTRLGMAGLCCKWLCRSQWIIWVFRIRTCIQATGQAPTRSYHSCTYFRGELYVFGGNFPNPDPQPDGCSNDLFIFDPSKLIWCLGVLVGHEWVQSFEVVYGCVWEDTSSDVFCMFLVVFQFFFKVEM